MNAAVTRTRSFAPGDFNPRHFLDEESCLRKVIDVGFMRPPVDAGLMSEPIVKEHFEVVICRKHPLAGGKSVTLAELAGEPLLIHDRSFSTNLYDKILDLYRRAGVTPKITHTSSFPYEEAEQC